MAVIEMCHCGKPLHYNDQKIQVMVDQLVIELGPEIEVIFAGKIYLVPRHYIALHGLRGSDVPHLGFKEKSGAGDRD